jgi:hypothetical protein
VPGYSITLSASASTLSGMTKPMALAVLGFAVQSRRKRAETRSQVAKVLEHAQVEHRDVVGHKTVILPYLGRPPGGRQQLFAPRVVHTSSTRRRALPTPAPEALC